MTFDQVVSIFSIGNLQTVLQNRQPGGAIARCTGHIDPVTRFRPRAR
ncbi:Uncharacterised protein [Shigella sonnei]|nr:Uncharacterised protein [Shigella sonnei]